MTETAGGETTFPNTALMAPPVETATPLPSAMARWYVLMVMCLVYTISIADRYAISTVLEPIRQELHLTDSGVAFLTGVSLAFFYVSFGLPISVIADRGSRRNLITISLVAWSALTILSGLARNYWQFLFSRIGVGIGEAGGTPAASSIISDYFPPERRPMAQAIFSLGAPLGAWVAYGAAGAIADLYGWRAVFLALGLPGILVGILVYLTVREPRRGQLDPASTNATPPTAGETLRFLWSQRAAVHLMGAGAITCLWGWGLTFWTQAFLQRTYGLSPGDVGAMTGPIHLIGGIGATAFTGWLLGRPFFLKDSRRVAWLMGAGILLATVPSIILFWTRSLPLAQAMLWIFVPSIYFYIGPSYGLLNNLSPPRMRAQFCAITVLTANIGNLIIAPQAIGFLSDLFAGSHAADADSLRLALLCLAPTGFWAAYHFFYCARLLQHDQERALGAAR